jgi:peptidoglycan/LPS O-acetylase OafA/YrhL
MTEMMSMQPHLSHPTYRPDIDGLRAIAVLAVVVFHAFPSWAKGGFVGVDVFFVISGFLISSMIFESLERGTFTFSEFYARRIRRISPALLVVLIACYGFGWFALLADEYKQFGKHMAAGAGFVSNFALWDEAGYFDNAAGTKPLLHLWSLGIEEQFYIVWPLLLWFAWKWKFNLLTITMLIAVLSFSLNLTGITKDAVATFYSPQTRVWELLCGSVVAWVSLYKKPAFAAGKAKLDGWPDSALSRGAGAADGERLPDVVSFAGALLLACGFWGIKKEFSFPGLWAMVPVLGAVFIILAGPNAWLNRTILSNKGAVWIGLVSYPLYLWHWPLLSFARIVESEVPGSVIRFGAVIVSVLLAWLTYRFIERPIRQGTPSLVRVGGLSLAMLAVLLVGLLTVKEQGLEFRPSPVRQVFAGDIGHDAYFQYWAEKYYACANAKIAAASLKYSDYVRCLQSKNTADVDIVVVGDSHGEHLFMGIANALPQYNVAYYIRGGLPLNDAQEFQDIFAEITQSPSIRKVILAALWSRRVGELAAEENVESKLVDTIAMLESAGKQVFLTDNIPMFPFAPNRCSQVRAFSMRQGRCQVDKASVLKQSRRFKEVVSHVLLAKPGTHFIDVERYFCNDDACRMERDGFLLYRDNRHLNVNGSLYVGDSIVRDHPLLLKN